MLQPYLRRFSRRREGVSKILIDALDEPLTSYEDPVM